MRKISWVMSLILIISAITLYILESHYWYHPFILGVWLLFDNLACLRGKKTTLDLLIKKQYKKFILLFATLAIFGLYIELIGNFLLKLWWYPYLNFYFLIITIPLFYPFILMSFREMYNFVSSFIDNKIITAIFSMFLGIIIWEIPNIYSLDWVYDIPYISLEIFGLNIVVIIGWSILILCPFFIYHKLGIKNN